MKLAKLLHAWVSTLIPDCEISGLHNDSRQIKPGYLFFAYPGAAADGRIFIPQAIQAGAVAIVYEPHELPASCVLPNHIPCLPVPGLVKKLAEIANHFYGYPSRSLAVTGVTGTNGKTTIAYQLAQAYELLNAKAVYIGTLGQGRVNALQTLSNTTPDALCLQHLLSDYQHEGIQHICMEVSSHALSQKRVEGIEFKQAIYTNLTHDHLDYHHTMSAYAAAKAELFAFSSLNSAIINQDDEYALLMAANLTSSCQKLTYGLSAHSDIRAINWQSTLGGSQLEITSPWGKHQLQINTLGKFNVYNSLAVFTGLMANGFTIQNVIPVMAELQAAPGRMEVVNKEPCVLVDYAHTPDALENVLLTLNQLKQGRLIVVFGCGGDRDKTKRPIMGKIASQHADYVIVTSDNPRSEDPNQIISDISAGLLNSTPVAKISDRKEAISEALSMANPQDIILIAGKGHESYQQIGAKQYNFSDQEVVRTYANRQSLR